LFLELLFFNNTHNKNNCSEGGGDDRARTQPDARHYYQDGDVPYFLLTLVPGVRSIGPRGPFCNDHDVKLDANLLNIGVNVWTQLPVHQVFNAWSRDQRHTLSADTKVYIRRSAFWDPSEEDLVKAKKADRSTLGRLPSTLSILADTYVPYLRAHEALDTRRCDAQCAQRGTVRARAAYAHTEERNTRRCTELVGEPEPSPKELIDAYCALHLLAGTDNGCVYRAHSIHKLVISFLV